MADETSDELEPRPHADSRGLSMVVGLGASAGGIRALSEFFAQVPANTPIAYVVILHLSPDHESKLAEVLQASTSMPVTQVRATVALEAGHVYVIPPNQSLEVKDGALHLIPMTRPDERRAPVDMFFRTLADAYGPRAAAVVLSGTGPNGSSGIRRVKEYGGLTAAQDPDEAEYRDMPRNSIATGLVDFVVPVGEIPGRILAYLNRMEREDAAISEPPAPDGAGPGPSTTGALRAAQDWRDILSTLRVRTGQDFSNYKPATLRRRVERRLNVRGLTTLAQYVRLLREHPEEPAALMKELLISVTNFFRDPEVFLALETRVIPELFSRKRGGDQVRVWSAGCATGEEAYSLAMLLAEHASTLIDGPAVQVFATDLDESAIAQAREGLYSEAEVADVSPERLQRFFQRETGGFRVRRELRELVLFAHHNVTRDPPFSHLDLIACRNLLIYLNRPVQQRLIETFHFALRPGGYLLLGTSESAEDGSDLFTLFDRNAHIYESRMVSSRLSLPLADRSQPPAPTFQRLPEPRGPSERISPGDLHLRLLEQYSPPSFVVNEENVLLHASPLATRYLQLPPGEPSRDILRIVIPELRPDLRTALHLAAQQRGPVDVGGVRLANPAGDQHVTISVKPSLRDDDPPRGYFLVVLREEAATTGGAEPAGEALHLKSPAEPEARRLEDELHRIKSQLRTTVEQFEAHSEEARAANEELQAMNEELRSAAEELETSKEELQSVNEELTTVNQELKIKIEELGLTNNDFQNLINSTDIGTIFLDRSLRVKLSTPAAQKIFNLLPTDIGRRLSDITSRLLYDALHEDMLQVLEKLQTIEREVQTKEGRNYLMRILPYRTTDDRIDGVSLTFHDITDWRQAESRGRASEERLRVLIDSAIDYAIFTITEEGRVDSWNAGAERMFGYRADEIIGQDAGLLFTPDDRQAGMPARELSLARATGRASDERWHQRKDGSRLYCSGVTTRLGGGSLGFAKIARDLTSARQAEVNLQHAHNQLEERISQRTGELQAEVARHFGAQQHVVRLLHRIVTAQEDERTRIARDLHDQLGQRLTALRLSIERHREAQHASRSDEELERALTLARQIDSEVDFLAWELRPAALDDLGLIAALPRYLSEWSAHHGITTEFQTTGSLPLRLSSEAETTLYRVTQEALTNVLKHAHATRVDVVLEGQRDAVTLVIEDNGGGFDVAAVDKAGSGIGLIGMRERAALINATLQVESAPGKGTTIYLRYPVGDGSPV